MHIYLANTESSSWQTVWSFFSNGGWFMLPILACSFVSVSVAVYKFMTLSKSLVIPQDVVNKLDVIDQEFEKNQVSGVMADFAQSDTTLGRLSFVALSSSNLTQADMQEAVQSAANEEIVKMSSGMPALEVVITIAPLIGLLGTASGLVIVFANVGNGADSASVGQGIAMALNTTVAGLAVAVPTVIVHSHFNRKIETMSARLEVLLGKLTSACHQYSLRNSAQ